MTDPQSKPKPTLEELLRLKRAERPGSDFWTGFERELRQKQLTALVEKRKWWHGLALPSSKLLYLPIGASAVLAMAFVSMRLVSPSPLGGVVNVGPGTDIREGQVELLPATVVAGAFQQADRLVPAVVEIASTRISSSDSVVPQATSGQETSPSARSIAANLARLEQAEPELIQAFLGSRLSSSAREKSTEEFELESATTKESAPRYRLIARYAERVLTPKPAAPAVYREHLARRLGDDLEGDMSRIGLGGDRVSLKF